MRIFSAKIMYFAWYILKRISENISTFGTFVLTIKDISQHKFPVKESSPAVIQFCSLAIAQMETEKTTLRLILVMKSTDMSNLSVIPQFDYCSISHLFDLDAYKPRDNFFRIHRRESYSANKINFFLSITRNELVLLCICE